MNIIAWLKKQSLTKRIFSGYILSAIIFICAATYGVDLVRSYRVEYNNILRNYAIPMNSIQSILKENQKIRSELYNITADNKSNIEQSKTTIEESMTSIKKEIEVLKNANYDGKDKPQFQALLVNLQSYYNEINKNLEDINSSDKKTDVSKLNQAVEANINQPLQKIYEFKSGELVRLEKQINDKATEKKILLAVFVGFGILVSMIVGNQIAKGINKMLEQADMHLEETSKKFATYSNELAVTSTNLADGSSKQAAFIQETSATMSQTVAMVTKNNQHTKEALTLVEESADVSEHGLESMGNMKRSMNELKESSGKIAKIVKVIDDIAFQTNILALNAAVEAARAGDVGKGFAVVAEEVRNLAQKSAQAAKDTTDIIERNIELSNQGVNMSIDVAEVLEKINSKIHIINTIINEIAQASEEQEKGVSQVNESIKQMEDVTQQNAATSQESSAISQQLSYQAEELANLVFELSKMITGTKDAKLNN